MTISPIQSWLFFPYSRYILSFSHDYFFHSVFALLRSTERLGRASARSCRADNGAALSAFTRGVAHRVLAFSGAKCGARCFRNRWFKILGDLRHHGRDGLF